MHFTANEYKTKENPNSNQNCKMKQIAIIKEMVKEIVEEIVEEITIEDNKQEDIPSETISENSISSDDQIVYVMNPYQAGELLHDKHNIVIITGSQLSTESGVPCSADDYKTWKFNKKYTKDLKTVAATRYTKHYLTQKWQWAYSLVDAVRKQVPSQAHAAIADFQRYCKAVGKTCSIVTEAIDGLHAVNSKRPAEADDEDDLVELNGSVMHMSCIQQCSPGKQPVSKRGLRARLEDQVPF